MAASTNKCAGTSKTRSYKKITQKEYDKATAIYEKKSYGDNDLSSDDDKDSAIIRQHEKRKQKAKKRHKKANRRK